MLDYLGRYTHRVAIANSRLLACEDGRVRFTWKDYRKDGVTKVMTLDATEFPSRWGCCHPHTGSPEAVARPRTGSPEAVARPRLPQNVACRFPALRSSEVGSQHSDRL